MKKLVLITLTLFATMSQAQEQKQIPQVSVTGEGKIKVKPDQVEINFGVENLGKDAQEVKKLNDEKVDKVVKYIKKFGIPLSDFQTTNVTLNRNYDYDKKKYNYQASQNISILLKDVSKYDALMMGLVDNGINNISDIEFKSSKIEEHKSEARKAAMRDAKKKAEDYVSVLNQKVGKALLITDNPTNYFQPQPMYKNMAMAQDASSEAPQETLAVGEIQVVTNVSVSFMLE
ncbi:SIMPL domain-containing protein [Flavobacterium sp.]|uniref:SIMPL domain-containing protein n=1 Tax=Flavobacterium sp. TaxID=239 RepID=UPI0037528679